MNGFQIRGHGISSHDRTSTTGKKKANSSDGKTTAAQRTIRSRRRVTDDDPRGRGRPGRRQVDAVALAHPDAAAADRHRVAVAPAGREVAVEADEPGRRGRAGRGAAQRRVDRRERLPEDAPARRGQREPEDAPAAAARVRPHHRGRAARVLGHPRRAAARRGGAEREAVVGAEEDDGHVRAHAGRLAARVRRPVEQRRLGDPGADPRVARHADAGAAQRGARDSRRAAGSSSRR